jgi:hypothetical protein
MVVPWRDLQAAMVFGWLGGYDVGRRQMQAWEQFAQHYNERLGHLRYCAIVRPFALFVAAPEMETVYREAVQAYLLGLPNASVPQSVRCLEAALADRHAAAGASGAPKLFDLIEWAETKLAGDKDAAHAFRLLRNVIHTRQLLDEATALETVRNVTTLVNRLFPFEKACHSQLCRGCGAPNVFEATQQDYYLGNVVNVACGRCSSSTPVFIL